MTPDRDSRRPVRFVVTFVAEPGRSAPAIVRLRHLLKLALRVCGLRCVDVREET